MATGAPWHNVEWIGVVGLPSPNPKCPVGRTYVESSAMVLVAGMPSTAGTVTVLGVDLPSLWGGPPSSPVIPIIRVIDVPAGGSHAGLEPAGESAGMLLGAVGSHCLRAERQASNIDCSTVKQESVAIAASEMSFLVIWDKLALRSVILSTAVLREDRLDSIPSQIVVAWLVAMVLIHWSRHLISVESAFESREVRARFTDPKRVR